jgi:adhesin transport system outer membrane protein
MPLKMDQALTNPVPAAGSDASPQVPDTAAVSDSGGAESSAEALRALDSMLESSLGGATPEDSQDVDGGATEQVALSLGDVLRVAWQENPQVLQAARALKATGFDVSSARAGFYPFATIEASETRGGSSSTDGTSSTVSLIQPLWSGGSTVAEVDQAKASQLQALAELNGARLQVGLQVAEAYLNVVGAGEQALQYQRYVFSLENLLGIIQRRAAKGVAPSADVDTALTRLNQARASARAVFSTLLSNRAQLAKLLGYSVEVSGWPDEATVISADESIEAERKALIAHPSVKGAEAQLERQKATVRLSKARIWPELQLQYRHEIDAPGAPEDDQTLLLMQYQTDNGIKGFRAYQGERQRTEAARASLQTAIRDVRSTIQIARVERLAAAQQMSVQEEAAKSASALVISFMRQFEVGRKTWLEVLNAQREANETVLQVSTVRRNYWLANARLALQGLYWQRLSTDAPPIDVEITKD